MIHSQRLLRYAISRKEEAASSNLWLSTNCRNKSLRLYLTILSHCYVTCSKAAIDKTTLWSNSSDWLSTLFKCECSQLRIIQNVFVNAQQNDNFQAKPYLSHICFFFFPSRHKDILFCFSPLPCIPRCTKSSNERLSQ